MSAPDVDEWARLNNRSSGAVDQRLARLRRGCRRQWPALPEMDALILDIADVARRERRSWSATHRRLLDLARLAFDVAAVPPRRD